MFRLADLQLLAFRVPNFALVKNCGSTIDTSYTRPDLFNPPEIELLENLRL